MLVLLVILVLYMYIIGILIISRSRRSGDIAIISSGGRSIQDVKKEVAVFTAADFGIEDRVLV